MRNDKLILDIRYFESDTPNVDGFHPADLGKLLTLPRKSSALTGARIARKLRELGFTTGVFDHVYINFSTAAASGEVSFANRSEDRYHAWYRYVDVGVKKMQINRFSTKRKQAWLEAVTLQVMTFLAGKSKEQLAIVDEVCKQLTIHGDALPIVHKIKETKTYSVIVSYQIAPEMKQSTAWVEYVDRKTGQRRLGCFAKLEFYEDIFFLVSSVVVARGTIVFKPRSSFKADLYNKRYKVPITIDIDDLPIA